MVCVAGVIPGFDTSVCCVAGVIPGFDTSVCCVAGAISESDPSPACSFAISRSEYAQGRTFQSGISFPDSKQTIMDSNRSTPSTGYRWKCSCQARNSTGERFATVANGEPVARAIKKGTFPYPPVPVLHIHLRSFQHHPRHRPV